MKRKATRGARARDLSRLLAVGAEGPAQEGQEASEEAVAELLQVRFARPLPLDKDTVDSVPAILGRPFEGAELLDGQLLRKILLSQHLPLPLVEVVKDYGKGLCLRWPSGAEHGVAVVIYYAAIANALVYHKEKITELGWADLHRFFGVLVDEKRLPEDISTLLAEAQGVCAAEKRSAGQ